MRGREARRSRPCVAAANLLPSMAVLASLAAAPLHAAPDPGDRPGIEAKPSERRLHLGLWTLHLRYPDRGLENNWLVGVSVGKVYGATFVNSFGDRAYTAGFQDVVLRWGTGRLSVGLGYRAGVVTGYDERFLRIARKLPVLPLLQPRAVVEAERLGVELSYSGVVASAGFTVRF